MFKLVDSISVIQLRHLSLVLLFFSSVLKAEQLNLSATLNIGTSLIEKKIDQAISENSTISRTITGLKYESLFPITIEQINLNSHIPASTTKKTSQINTFETSIAEIQIHGEISNLHIQGVIEKEISGVKIKINVDSVCKNILFSGKTVENVFSTAIVENSVDNQIKSLFSYKSLDIQFEPFQCTQIQGIEQLIIQNIQTELSKQLPIEQMISEQVSHLLSEKVKSFKVEALNKLNMFVKSIDPEIKVNIQKTSTADKTSVLVDKTEFEKTIQQALAKKLKNFIFSSDDVPELKKLLSSRFKQFFIWPALMSRPKNKALQFQPALENFSFSLLADQVTTVADLNIILGQWVKDDNASMVYFRSQANFINASKAYVELSSLTNSYIWDKNYIAQNKVSERISLSIVNSSLQKLVQQKITAEIFSAQDSFLKFVQSFYLHNGTLQIFLE